MSRFLSHQRAPPSRSQSRGNAGAPSVGTSQYGPYVSQEAQECGPGCVEASIPYVVDREHPLRSYSSSPGPRARVIACRKHGGESARTRPNQVFRFEPQTEESRPRNSPPGEGLDLNDPKVLEATHAAFRAGAIQDGRLSPSDRRSMMVSHWTATRRHGRVFTNLDEDAPLAAGSYGSDATSSIAGELETTGVTEDENVPLSKPRRYRQRDVLSLWRRILASTRLGMPVTSVRSSLSCDDESLPTVPETIPPAGPVLEGPPVGSVYDDDEVSRRNKEPKIDLARSPSPNHRSVLPLHRHLRDGEFICTDVVAWVYHSKALKVCRRARNRCRRAVRYVKKKKSVFRS
jgi:hypothetical protein